MTIPLKLGVPSQSGDLRQGLGYVPAVQKRKRCGLVQANRSRGPSLKGERISCRMRISAATEKIIKLTLRTG